MAETDLSEPTVIDRDTMLVGLTAIGIRLYAGSGEALPDSILAAERVGSCVSSTRSGAS
jgi:hypothetical protein